MELLQPFVLGMIQGVTEFIPVSSSAHLILFPWLFKWQDPGLAFDVFLHLGTLLALLAAGRACEYP
jgi:undecaprenyl-diphosphatase